MDEINVYEIRVVGQLPDHWSDWFDGLAVHNDLAGETTLIGPLVDQSALIGVLGKIHALNLALVSVQKVSC